MGRNAEKQTIRVGKNNSSIGETVSFTAEVLGTVKVNGGAEADDGWDATYYRLPDETFRVLVEGQNVALLLPSNMVEAIKSGQHRNFTYGRMTLEEMKAESTYQFWEGYKGLMHIRSQNSHRIVDLDDTESAEQLEELEHGMEKHTLSVGTERVGETVSFTAKKLGTVQAEGDSGGDLEVTYYRLPDDTYRAYVEREGTSMLQPSNLAEVLGSGEPAEYGRWTLEELQGVEFYGGCFTKLMAVHPEGKERIVRDLD